MRICIPVENNEWLRSKIYDHFGGAPFFLIYDTNTKAVENISNSNQGHIHGACNPLTVLNSNHFI
ncbi:MAG: hypothetical protein KJ732_00340 [Candidatus Margulisbacteria bacterium]|nr:hypothetical protein [Candidatus Margulisiibacteriota bacterium]